MGLFKKLSELVSGGSREGSSGHPHRILLVGLDNSGKSTIIQLIERFYDPTAGSVLLDGADLKTLNLKWLRQQIGLVGQETILFLGSVSDNIGYGKEGATKEEIVAAMKGKVLAKATLSGVLRRERPCFLQAYGSC